MCHKKTALKTICFEYRENMELCDNYQWHGYNITKVKSILLKTTFLAIA